jgi:transcriptional regulator with XRE-family HTH domain
MDVDPVVRNARNGELGHFLRTRRERVSPESVGMSSGPRRRTRGLRREEVAVLANVSPTWYTYLEQGRRIRPSVEVLDSLADALLLTAAERRYLHALGAVRAHADAAAVELAPEHVAMVKRVVAASGADSCPVYATEGAGNLIAWNAHVSDWYTDFAAVPEPNIVRWLFTAPEARHRIADWNTDARDILSRVRYAIGVGRIGAPILAMIDELCTVSSEFRTWWDLHDVNDQDARSRTFRHSAHGICSQELFVVHPAACPSVSIVFHLLTPR